MDNIEEIANEASAKVKRILLEEARKLIPFPTDFFGVRKWPFNRTKSPRPSVACTVLMTS